MAAIIYKYPLMMTEKQVVSLPRGSQVLSVQMQREELKLWALVDLGGNPATDVHIGIYGTGHTIDDKLIRHIDTFQVLNESLVFHVFEIERP